MGEAVQKTGENKYAGLKSCDDALPVLSGILSSYTDFIREVGALLQHAEDNWHGKEGKRLEREVRERCNWPEFMIGVAKRVYAGDFPASLVTCGIPIPQMLTMSPKTLTRIASDEKFEILLPSNVVEHKRLIDMSFKEKRQFVDRGRILSAKEQKVRRRKKAALKSGVVEKLRYDSEEDVFTICGDGVEYKFTSQEVGELLPEGEKKPALEALERVLGASLVASS